MNIYLMYISHFKLIYSFFFKLYHFIIIRIRDKLKQYKSNIFAKFIVSSMALSHVEESSESEEIE